MSIIVIGAWHTDAEVDPSLSNICIALIARGVAAFIFLVEYEFSKMEGM